MTTTVTGNNAGYSFAGAELTVPVPAESYVVNSKGCLPIINTAAASAGAAATASSITTFGTGTAVTTAAITGTYIFEVSQIVRFHCVTNGVCCVTNLCNGSIKIGLSLFNIVLLLASVLLLKASF